MSNKAENEGKEERAVASPSEPIDGVHLDEELVDGVAPPLKKSEEGNSDSSATPTPASQEEATPVPTPPPAVTRHDSSATVTASSHSRSSHPLAPLSSSTTTNNAEPNDDVEPPTSSSFSVSPSSRYFPLSTATMDTSVFDVVHIFSERGISAVPILDEDGVVLNMYETVDIVVSGFVFCVRVNGGGRRRASQSSREELEKGRREDGSKTPFGSRPITDAPLRNLHQDLVRTNAYQILDGPISLAISQRSADFTGVITCTPRDTLSSILAYIRERRCHRFVIVEPEDVPADPKTGAQARKKGSLVGILSLSDVLRYLVGHENLKGHEVPGLGESLLLLGLHSQQCR